MSKVTCVSGYWDIKNKYGNKSYNKWFKNSLKINCPYVFFSDKETIKIIKKYRKDLPTHYIEFNIENFYTYKYKNKMRIDKTHCPSKELNLIWHEKIFLIKKAYEINKFNSEYFMWVDAGLAPYRDKIPPSDVFPNIDKLNLLPKDKLVYSATKFLGNYDYNENLVKKNSYYHYIAGTSYILHKSKIEDFVNIYKNYLDKLLDNNNIWTDQVIWTHIFRDNKKLFYKLCNGYGEIVCNLY